MDKDTAKTTDDFQAYIRSESIYRNLLKTTPDAIVVLDREGDIIKVNESASSLFNEERNAMIGNNYRDYIEGEKPDLESLFKGTRTFKDYILALKRADNTSFEAEVSATYIDNEPDGFEAYILVIRDITEKRRNQRELQRSAERYANLIQIMNEGFAVIDKNTLITYINEEASRITGKTFDEIIGISFYIFLDAQGIKTWHEQVYLPKTESDGRANFDLTLFIETRKVHTRVSTRNYYSSSGELQGTVAVITDITRLRTLEDEIKQIEHEMISSLFDSLSEREKELLRYLSHGYNWPADKRKIARIMDVLPGTLDKFLARIKQKLNLYDLQKILMLAESKMQNQIKPHMS